MKKTKQVIEEELDETIAIDIEKELDEFYPPTAGNELQSNEAEPLAFADLVDEVLAGKWGNGQDRRRRLAEAGFDHVAVQKEIVKRANNR